MREIQHGTNAGYQLERRRGLPVCDACRAARRDYMAGYRTRRLPGAVRAQMANRATSRALWRLRSMHENDFDALFADEMRVEITSNTSARRPHNRGDELQ